MMLALIFLLAISRHALGFSSAPRAQPPFPPEPAPLSCPSAINLSPTFEAAENYLDTSESYEVVEEEYDVQCRGAIDPFIITLCDKVKHDSYASMTNHVNPVTNVSDVYWKMAPRFQAKVYRPRNHVGPMPVLLFQHGNFNVCGQRLQVQVSVDGEIPAPSGFARVAGTEAAYSWTDPGIPTWAAQLGAYMLGNCHPTEAEWNTLLEAVDVNGRPYDPQELAQILGFATFPELVTFLQAQAPDNDLNVNQDSHMGYRYAALPLAARGFFVVSALNVAAVSSWNQAYTLLNDDNDLGGEAGWARNGLAHLELLGRLNEGVQLGNVGEGEDLTGKLDMQNIGLMGHSRGGQSVRIMQEALRTGEGNVTGGPLPCANTALPIDQQVPLTFCEDKGPMTSAYPNIPAYHVAAVIEIAPVDFQTYFSPDNYITPVDTPWLVLIPMCDNDVNALSGRCPFDRAVQRASQTGSLPKSMMAIFQIDGTSHDTYNSHWQEQDYAVCHSANNVLQSVISGRNFEGPLGTHLGLDDPRLVASAVLANWFAAFVGQGADTKYSQLFDPAFALPYIVGLTAVTENHIKRCALKL